MTKKKFQKKKPNQYYKEDFMPKVPTKVEELNAEADELIASLKDDDSNDVADEEKDTKPTDKVGGSDTSDDTVVGDDVEDDDKISDSDDFDELKEHLNYWKNKYDVLQGKYDAEVSALNTLVGNLQDRLEAVEKTPSIKENDTSDYEYDSFKDDYPDIYSAVNQMLESKLENITQVIVKQLDELKQRTTQSEESSFYTTLDKLVPEWAKLNTNPKFLNWLQKVEPYTGATREALLKHAYDSRDAKRASLFFKQFLKETDRKRNVNSLETPPTRSNSVTPSEPKEIREDVIQDFAQKALQAVKHGDYKKSEEIENELDSLLRKASAV